MKVLKSAKTLTVIALLFMQISFSVQTPAQAAFIGGGTSGSCSAIKILRYWMTGIDPSFCIY